MKKEVKRLKPEFEFKVVKEKKELCLMLKLLVFFCLDTV